MKKDQYIPHELSTRNTTEVIRLIEEQGMAGYGIYWCLLEYLRTQDNYSGDMRVLKSLARRMKIRLSKLLTILNDYGLFICNDYTFYSPKLVELMQPFEERRRTIKAYKEKKKLDNILEISATQDTINILEGKVKGKGKVEVEGKETSSSTEEEAREAAEAAAALLPEKESWETYVDELDGEAQWKELMAMRSGLKMQFYPLYPRIVEAFKNHVRILGNERHIVSLSEAKRYFCFFLTQGSTTFNRLMDELKRKDGKDPFRFEYRDKETGQRMYCGLPIPEDAPPRPCDQAVWNPASKKWFY